MKLNRTAYNAAENAYMADLGRPFERTSLRAAIKTYLVHVKVMGDMNIAEQEDAIYTAFAATLPDNNPQWTSAEAIIRELHDKGLVIRRGRE